MAGEKNDRGLVGRFFHIWGNDGYVQLQGRVIERLDQTHYLVQFYEWLTGEASPMHIYTVDAMANTTPDAMERRPSSWQFYQDEAHWRDWYRDKYPKRAPSN